MQMVKRALGATLALLAATPAAAAPAALGVQLDDRGEAGRVIVEKVLPGLTAAAIGLREGDEVLTIGDMAVTDADAVVGFMQKVSAGDEIRLFVRRGGEQIELKGTAAPRPEGMQTGRLRMEPGAN
jgi:S1-C subfamily serine protease